MMKSIKIIYILSALMLFSLNLYPQDINETKRLKLLIYNFITTDNYDNVKKKENNYNYYSIVIPQTILKSLTNTENYEITRKAGPLTIETVFSDKDKKEEYYKKMVDLGHQNKSEYIITGNFNVIDNKLNLHVVIFDVRGEKIEIIDHISDELGVKLRRTTDLLSQKISEKIANLDLLFKEYEASSGFKPLQTPLSIITLGTDSGYIFMSGQWSSLYNNCFYIAPFIDFDLTDSFSLSLKFNSIESSSKDTETITNSRLKILSSSLSLSYLYRFNSCFGIGLSAGGGGAKTTITMMPGSPFTNSLSEKDSYDPTLDISSYFVYNISTFTFKTGILYKRIFYKDEPLNSGIIFAGIGIHF